MTRMRMSMGAYNELVNKNVAKQFAIHKMPLSECSWITTKPPRWHCKSMISSMTSVMIYPLRCIKALSSRRLGAEVEIRRQWDRKPLLIIGRMTRCSRSVSLLGEALICLIRCCRAGSDEGQGAPGILGWINGWRCLSLKKLFWDL